MSTTITQDWHALGEKIRKKIESAQLGEVSAADLAEEFHDKLAVETERRKAAEAYIKSMTVTGWNNPGRYAYEECRKAMIAWQATIPKEKQ